MTLRERAPRTINLPHSLGGCERDFGGGNADDGTVFLVEGVNSDGSITVEFVVDDPPLRQGCEFGARDFGQGREDKTFDCQTGYCRDRDAEDESQDLEGSGVCVEIHRQFLHRVHLNPTA